MNETPSPRKPYEKPAITKIVLEDKPAVALALNRASSGDDFIWQYYQEFVSSRLKLILSFTGHRLLVHRRGPADLRG